MRNSKTVFLRFNACQLDAMADFLESQAEKGWFLKYDEASVLLPGILRFRRGEPAQGAYCVVLIPGTSEWEETEDERISRCRKMFGDFGWRLEGRHYRYFVFYNDHKKAAPPQTDDGVWYEAAGELWKKTLPVYAVILILMLFNLLRALFQPSLFVFDNSSLRGCLFMLLTALLFAGLGAGHLVWLSRTGEKIRRGEKRKPVSLGSVLAVNGAELFAYGSWLFYLFFGTRFHYTLWYYLYVVVLAAAFLWLLLKAARFFRKIGTGEENETLFAVAVCAGLILLGGGSAKIMETFFPGLPLYREEACAPDALSLPLDMESFGYQKDENIHMGRDESVLAKRQTGGFKGKDAAAGSVSVTYLRAESAPVLKLLYLEKQRALKDSFTETGTDSLGAAVARRYETPGAPAYPEQARSALLVENGREILELTFYGEPDTALTEAALKALSGR